MGEYTSVHSQVDLGVLDPSFGGRRSLGSHPTSPERKTGPLRYSKKQTVASDHEPELPASALPRLIDR